MKIKVSIIIPTMTKDLITNCLDSIIKYTNLDGVEIIVVINGMNDSSLLCKEYEEYSKYIKFINYNNPLGAVIAYNNGIKAAQGDYILLMNDDCAILDSPKNYWLDELLKPFFDPKMAVTGAVRSEPNLAGNFFPWAKDKVNYGFIIFFCALISKNAFDEIGLLDETFQCGVDIDFCMRAKDKGYNIAQVPEEGKLQSNKSFNVGRFPIYHQGERTVHGYYGNNKWKEILKYDADILNDRYGIRNKE